MKNRKKLLVASPTPIVQRVPGADSPLDLFDRKGAAAYLGLPARTFDRLVARKKLSVIRHGPRVVRFTRVDLDAYSKKATDPARN